jgi:hypothetical protein
LERRALHAWSRREREGERERGREGERERGREGEREHGVSMAAWEIVSALRACMI